VVDRYFENGAWIFQEDNVLSHTFNYVHNTMEAAAQCADNDLVITKPRRECHWQRLENCKNQLCKEGTTYKAHIFINQMLCKEDQT
jgi:hypothetical protein